MAKRRRKKAKKAKKAKKEEEEEVNFAFLKTPFLIIFFRKGVFLLHAF